MKIIIDLQSLQGISCNRGIGRYSLSLSQELARQAKNHEIYLLLNTNLTDQIAIIRDSFDNLIPQDRIKLFDAPKKISGHDYKATWRIKAAEKIREHFINNLSPDIVYLSSVFEGWIDDVPVSIGEFQSNHLTVATLYDLIPFIYPDLYIKGFAAPHFFFQKMQYLKKSDLLITLSESASQEASNYLAFPKDKIVNCSAGLDPKFKKIEIDNEEFKKIKNIYGITRDFILYIGGIDYRKNVNGLVEAFSLLPIRKKFQLVIIVTINDEAIIYFSNFFKVRFNLNADELILIRYVPEDALILLYNTCSLFVFPSFHEGFGLPILEAMACGAPVISSNMTSIPEVTGCQEALFDPKDSSSIINKMLEALTNENFKNFLKQHGQMQIKKFTWENTAKKALNAFEQLYETKKIIKPVITPIRKKMAYISPLPAEKSGIADYSSQLIPELACYYDITLISDQLSVEDVWLNANFQIHSINWFTQHAKKFDIILYHFGNSSLHHYMFDLLNTYPGIVVLHDFFLSGLLDWMDDFLPNKNYIFNQTLYHSHGFQALVYQEKNGRIKTHHAYPCNHSVLKQALGVVVHSQYSIELVKKWYGSSLNKKIRLIHHLSRSNTQFTQLDKNKAKEELGFTKDDFLICSFGNLHPNKLNHRLITCSLNLLKENKNIYLIFIGEEPYPSYYETLLSIIKIHKLRKKIHFKGFSNKEEFHKFLLATDIAVQLRSNSRGETSGCLLTCLSYGIPTIANSHGSIKELPNNIIIRIEDDFKDQELNNALYQIYTDSKLRQSVSEKALEYINEKHRPDKIGKQFNQVIEELYHENKISESALIQDLVINNTHLIHQEDLVNISKIIATNRENTSFPQLLIDISDLVANVNCNYTHTRKNLFKKIMNSDSLKHRIEPIYYNKDKNTYFYARQLTSSLLNLSENGLIDTPIDVYPNDFFVILFPVKLGDTSNQLKLLNIWKTKSLKICLLIPDHNIAIDNYLFEIADGCICLNQEITSSLINYLNASYIKRDTSLKIEFSNHEVSNGVLDKVVTISSLNKWSSKWSPRMIAGQQIPSIKKTININKSNYQFEGDVRYLSNAPHEFDSVLFSIFKSFCHENAFVLDIGANIGLTAVALADICAKGKIAAVEPFPPSFEFLKRNIANAQKNNISLHHFAVGNKSGEIEMRATNDFLAGAFIADQFIADKQHFCMNVKLESLDNIFHQFCFNKLDFIKMDLEGYEVFALEGAKEILEKYKPVVSLEMNHWCLNVFHRMSLPEFQERLCKLFPFVYAIEGSTYLDFSTTDNFYHIAHEHVTTTHKYFNLIAGFNQEEILSNLNQMANYLKSFV